MKERVPDEIRFAVEEACIKRITAPTDKELLKQFPISRASLYRIMRAARIQVKKSQSEK